MNDARVFPLFLSAERFALSILGKSANSHPANSHLANSHLANSNLADSFAESLKRAYQKWNDQKRTTDLLPALCLNREGSEGHAGVALTVAWQMLQYAARLLDDIADGDSPDPGGWANLSTGFLSAAQQALWSIEGQGATLEQIEVLVSRLHQATLAACSGQHEDLRAQKHGYILTPNQWMEIARKKSGALFGWAAWAGALLSQTTEEQQEEFWSFGCHVGALLQVTDDANDVWEQEDAAGLRAIGVSLPFVYAWYVGSVEDRQLLKEQAELILQGEEDAVPAARPLLNRLGTQNYVIAVAQSERDQALEALARAGDPTSEQGAALIQLVNEIFPAFL